MSPTPTVASTAANLASGTTTPLPNFKPSYHTCTQVTTLCPVSATMYSYRPNLGGNIFFLVFFTLLTAVHLVRGLQYRTWTFIIAMVGGGLCEILGYATRIVMHYNPWQFTAVKIQLVTLIIAPSFTAAGIYLTTKHVVMQMAPALSPMPPWLFTWIFVCSDVLSLVIQAGGAGSEASTKSKSRTDEGNDAAMAGIALQVATLLVCAAMMGVFFRRYYGAHARGFLQNKEQRQNRMWIVLATLLVAFVTVLIRCVYRLPEMAGGLGGQLMKNETEFLTLDGM